MVPFSSENIARSASFDPSNAVPVSEAARATHESFESHLRHAAATTVDQSTRESAQKDESLEPSESTSNEPAQNEPVRQETDESQRDDGDVRVADDADAATAAETPAERKDKEVVAEAASADEVVIVTTADELLIAIQEGEPEASADSDDEPDQVTAAQLTVAPPGSDESELDTSLATNTEESTDKKVIKSGDSIPAGSEVNRVSSDRVEPSTSETSTRLVKPEETNETFADEEFLEAAQVPEATIPDDELPRASTTHQRHGHRVDVSPNQPTHETSATAPKPVAAIVVETTADIARDDGSQQRQHHRETDSPQGNGNTTAGDATPPSPETPSRFAQHLLAQTEDPNARGLSISDADQARFVDRVARAVQATGERGGTLRLRLSPPELGSLTLEVKVQGGVVSARVEADTSAARSLLLENLPLLRERLAEHGMRVDQFDVDLTDRHSGGTPDGLQQNDQQHEDRPREKATLHDPDDTPQAVTSETPTKSGNEQLNIIV